VGLAELMAGRPATAIISYEKLEGTDYTPVKKSRCNWRTYNSFSAYPQLFELIKLKTMGNLLPRCGCNGVSFPVEREARKPPEAATGGCMSIP